MIERVKLETNEILDLGYAKIYIDPKPLEEFTEDHLEELISSDYYSSNSNFLQWNFYWIILSENKDKGKLIKDIEGEEKYARRYVLTIKEYQKFLKRFPIYDKTKAGKVIMFHNARLGQKMTEAFDEFKRDWENTIFLHASVLNMYSALDMLEMFDYLRAQVLYGKNLIASFSIEEEMNLFKKKFGFLGSNYIER